MKQFAHFLTIIGDFQNENEKEGAHTFQGATTFVHISPVWKMVLNVVSLCLFDQNTPLTPPLVLVRFKLISRFMGGVDGRGGWEG